MRSLSIAVGGLVMVSSLALAQVDPKDPSGNTSANGSASTTDATFMKTLAQGGRAEVEAGKVASDKASDPAVKQFAQQMIRDHTKNNNELKTLAQTAGVTLPATTGRQMQAQQSKLESDNGASFDAAYIKDQVQDHQKTVQLLENEIQNGHDPAVRQFAQETLTVVSHHLDMAKQLESKLPTHVAAGGPSN
jgi:putative membrane protein